MSASELPSCKAKRLLAALARLGFEVVRRKGSHRFLRHSDGRTLLFAFHDSATIGPAMIGRIIKDAGATPDAIRKLI